MITSKITATEELYQIKFKTEYLQWKKFDEKAQMPTKRKTDVGYDVYTIENNVWLKPHETRLFSTGLGCLIPQNY